MTDQSMLKRISPLWLGVGISGSLLLLMFVIETMLGRWSGLLVGGEFDPLARVSGGMLRDTRLAIVHCLLMGYLPAALLQALRSGRRTVLMLQQALDCTRQECESLATSLRLSTRGLVIIGLAALALSLVGPYLIPPAPESPWNPATWEPEVVWHRILGPLTMIWAWWLVYTIITVSIRLSRIAKTLTRIDLLDLSPLSPFTQQGLTNALLLIGSLSIWSLMMIETGFGQMMLIIGVPTLASTTLALLAPVYGVHRRISQSKEEAFVWVNGEIAAHQAAFRGAESGQPGGRMADLIVYRGMIEDISEWPFTLSTYARIALYLFLPVATWGVGLIAEEIFGRLVF